MWKYIMTQHWGIESKTTISKMQQESFKGTNESLNFFASYSTHNLQQLLIPVHGKVYVCSILTH